MCECVDYYNLLRSYICVCTPNWIVKLVLNRFIIKLSFTEKRE